jgi:subtilisin family serine protease
MQKGIFIFLSIILNVSSIAQADRNFQVQALKEGSYTEKVSMFVKAEKSELMEYLKGHDGLYKYFSGGYHGITIPTNEVKGLLSQPFIKSSDFTLHRPHTLNDSMRVRDNINPIHAGTSPLRMAYTGKGVLIGIIDTGLDFLHPDLMDANGKTRVLKVWDQTFAFDAQLTPAFYGYGQAWDSSHINAGNCPSFDSGGGHGTTVTGTAAGNGFANGLHKGVAPDANLIIVKSNFNAANWLGTVADAVDYIYKVADSLDMPCVINASIGDYMGSHDGRDPAAKFIDSLISAKPGRLMVCAAGNSGNIGNYHVRHDINPTDTTFTWFQYNPSSALGYGAVFFEGYADTADLNNAFYSIGANLPSGSFSDRGRTSFVNIQDHLGTIHTETIMNGANEIATVDFYAELQGDVYLLQGHIQQPDSSNYNFRFMTTGNGAIDIWSTTIFGYSNIVNTGLPNSTVLPEIVDYVKADSSKIIVSSFSCGQNTVLVGNYYALEAYIDYDNVYQDMMETTGSISINSSRGPSRDNRIKPEISASGDVHMSAAPLDLLAWMIINEPFKVAQGGMHIRNGGTSMASPVVTGIAALALEKCPKLTSDEFRDMIIGTAKSNALTGTVPNMSYGYGHVDGFAALVTKNYPEPVANSFSPICANDSVEVSLMQSYSYYDWSDGTTGSTLWAKDSIYYSVTVGDIHGCKETLDSIKPSMYNSSSINISIDTINGFLISSPAVTYQWLYEGDTLVGETGQQIDYTIMGDGAYEVFGTDANGCVIKDIYFLNLNSISENALDDISIFPNPTNGEINISSEKHELSEIVLRDATGKMLVHLTKKNTKGTISIDMKNYARGIYFLEVETENGKLVKRVVRD